MFAWKFGDSPTCECENVTDQSMRYIVNKCPQNRPGEHLYTTKKNTKSLVVPKRWLSVAFSGEYHKLVKFSD